jgi:hypothetical protein
MSISIVECPSLLREVVVPLDNVGAIPQEAKNLKLAANKVGRLRIKIGHIHYSPRIIRMSSK